MERNDTIWQSTAVAQGFLEGMRRAIPLAAEQIDVMLRLIRSTRPEMKDFLDIGCGDGVLAQAILAHYPDTQGILLDFSEPMLEAARHKLAASRDQLRFVAGDYGSANWLKLVEAYAPFDAIVSGYSIHHQPDARKEALYREIYDLLAPGGVFINIEHVAPDSAWSRMLFDDLFIDSMLRHQQRQGINQSREEVAEEFHNRPHGQANILAPLDIQLEWLREIGFKDVGCFLQIFELALFAGVRSLE